MTFPIHQVIFFFFSIALIASALMVIVARNALHSLLFLVLCFFCSAVLWMSLQAEFLALVLIFVYVGAVMTLFLFVVMMLNVNVAAIKEKLMRYLPVGILVALLLMATMLFVLNPKHLKTAQLMPTHYGSDYSNVKAMGAELYLNYLYPFEIAALILLVAIIAAITLAYHGKRANTKSQTLRHQLTANKKDRLRLMDLKKDRP